MTTAAIYARFSSDLQDERSLADQVALCRQHAERQGWRVGEIYTDAAVSGASTHNRPGLAAMLEAARAGAFQILVTEAIDRLSRDLEDVAGLYKRLSFAGVGVVTLADGAVSQMHVGIKGLMASLFLADLAQKTRRGHIGRLSAGRSPGGKLYGYDVVPGEERGLRRINPAEAAVVRRIFADYTGGRSSRAIAAALNAEGIAAPRGGQWNASTITGSAARQNGIIQSRLYVGEIVYNRERMVKDPATGKRIHRLNPVADWIVQPAPELAIIDRATFDAAQELRARLSQRPLAYRHRPKHLLSGIAACGCCGGTLTIVNRDRLGCSARVNKGTCGNRRTIARDEVEARVLAAVRGNLLRPEFVAAFAATYAAERDRLARSRASAQRDTGRDLAALDLKISRIVAAIEAGGDGAALAARLKGLEAERRVVAARAVDPVDDAALARVPDAARRFRAKVDALGAAIQGQDQHAEQARALIRELLYRVTVTPGGTGGGPQSIEIEGDLAVMLDTRRTAPAVTGSRYHRNSAPRLPFKLAA